MLFLMLLACGGCGESLRLRTDDGLRRYLVHLPAGHDGESALPVVLALHGGGGTPEGLRESLELDALADAQGFMVVYPAGTGEKTLGQEFLTWNAEYCCGLAVAEQVDDLAFFEALLDDLAARYPVDVSRVYATGISNGGAMAHHLACQLPERFAAIAPIASPGAPSSCEDPEPVATLIIHGTEDRCALWDGGEQCGGCWEEALSLWLDKEVEQEHPFPCEAVEAQVADRVAQNGCVGEPEVFYAQGQATCTRWTGCEGDATVALCAIEGGGHSWPGTETSCDPETKFCQSYVQVVGEPSADLDASRVAWEFFSQHSLSER
ncbi:MAG: prolyl oligopeptidase family serine peptidase [Alphaproteobacteria bacterium]|nr:prolyl oligopeptidase family serine peptidase [Alphaproteobacteria bacterium]